MDKIIKYSRGATVSGKLPYLGFFLLVVSFMILAQSFLVIGFLLLYISFVLMLNVRGVLVNYSEKRYKLYFDIFIYKIGKWKSLETIDKLVLTKFLDKNRYRLGYINSTDVKTKTYDLYLITNSKAILLKEFVDYQKAWKYLVTHGKLLGIPTQDEILNLRKKPKHTRRR